jgi:hypothetical protein
MNVSAKSISATTPVGVGNHVFISPAFYLPLMTTKFVAIRLAAKSQI